MLFPFGKTYTNIKTNPYLLGCVKRYHYVLSSNGLAKKLDPLLQVGTLHWDTCTMPQDMWNSIGIHDVALGFMYLYLIISSNIGIYVIYLGIRVLHWDTCNCIGIYDNASRHDRDTSSHLPHGPLKVVLLTQFHIVLTLVHFYSLLGPHVRDFLYIWGDNYSLLE